MPRAGSFCGWCATVLVIGIACGTRAAAVYAADPAFPNDVFSCYARQCGVPPHGAFPHLVVGRVAAIADADQAGRLFNGMRRHGHWAGLPANSDLFWRNLQPVAIDAGEGSTFVTLMSQEEARAVPLQVGDFVRYSPHRGQYENPPSDGIAAVYWNVEGCVAILCRASDRPCMKRYASGVYHTSDGAQLSSTSLRPMKNGMAIDTETMIPRQAKQVLPAFPWTTLLTACFRLPGRG